MYSITGRTGQLHCTSLKTSFHFTVNYTHFTVDLIKPPFDAPANLFQLFSGSRLTELLRLINEVKENAGKHMA